MEMKNKRILVTGGAGFIGSHLVDKLLEHDFHVAVLDNFSTGKVAHLRPHLDKPNFRLVKGDVRNKADLKKSLKNVGTVFHFAAIVNVAFSLENPLLTNEVNVGGTLNLLNESLKAGVESLINVSSCAVYGDPVYTPIDEEHPVRPLSPYAASKLAAEHYCQVYHEVHGLKTTSLRFFNVYGSRQTSGPYSGVISRFIERLKKGQPPLIFGNGKQTRDFLYIRDAIDAALSVLNYADCAGEAINVGSGRETTINELAKVLIESFGMRSIKPKYTKPRAGDIEKSRANISKAQRLLGFKPQISLDEGLRRLVRNSR
jgi:UDP-glucose 4-epimerase